jgi:hypothetical protein
VLILVTPTSAEVFDEGTEIPFAAQVSDDADSAAALSLVWTSDRDGELNTDPADSLGLAGFSEAGLSTGDHLVTVVVTDSDGLTSDADVAFTVNGLPTAPVVSIEPDPASTTDDLVAVIDAESVDPEGQAVSYSYLWTVDGIAVPGGTDVSVSATLTSQGQEWTVEVQPSDGIGEGKSGTASVIIANTAPELDSVQLTPDPAYKGDSFSCTPGTGTDIDGDGVSYDIAWTVDGTLLTSSGAGLSDSWWSRDQAVYCTATPQDGTDAGAPVDSNTVVVSNSLPAIDSVSITPEFPAEGETLSCAYAGFADADGDSDNSSYIWSILGSEVGTGKKLSGVFGVGDTVICTVTPNDGTDDGIAVSNSVVVENTAPILSSVALTPLTAYADDTFTCTPGTVVDPDGHSVSYSYVWDISGNDPGETSPQLAPGPFGSDDWVSCTVTPSDGFDNGMPVTSNVVTILNTLPVLEEVILGPSPGYEASTMACTAGVVADIDGDAVGFAYSWTVSGTGLSVTDPTLIGSDFDKGDTVTCAMTPSDETGSGDTVSSNSVLIKNTLPTVDAVSITPSSPRYADTLTCAYTGFADDDGDADQSTYAWTVNGGFAGFRTTLAGAFVAGDTVTCTVTPNDGVGDGTTVSVNVRIENTPPVLDTARLTPLTIYEGDTFSCTPGTATDGDGHTVTYGYAWDVDGADPGVTDSTLDSAHWYRDQSVTCFVTPNDGTDDGTMVTSNTVVVSNTAPELSSAVLTPDPGLEGELLDCAATGGTDVDGDSVSYLTSWTVSGVPVASTEVFLDPTYFVQDDRVYCTVGPFDGDDTGVAVDSNGVTIENSPPSIGNVTITPISPNITDTLTCVYSDYTDPGGDADLSTFEWTLSGVTQGTDETLDGAFIAGDEVVCTVTPYDGEDPGVAKSAFVIIQNAEPAVADAVLTPTTAYAGDTLTCTAGATSDPDGDPVTIRYEWLVGTHEVGVNDDELDDSYWRRSDQVQCFIIPNDGIDDGPTVNSNVVTISNTVPEVTSITITPASPTTNDILLATVTTADVDGDNVSVSYEWFVDGSSVTSFNDMLDGSSFFSKGEEVTVEVTPADQEDSGTGSLSSGVVVINTPPGTPTVAIYPEESEPGLQDLVCTVELDSPDDDNDSISYSYSWELDGLVYPDDYALATGPTTTTDDGDTVPAADTSLGSSWTCTVVPNDGEADGGSAIAGSLIYNYTNVGNDIAYTGTTSLSGHEMRGIQVSVPNDCTLQRLALITPDLSGNVKLALYDDFGGSPDVLVVSSDGSALNGGTLEIDVAPTPIVAGSYWMFATYDQTTTVYNDASATTDVVYRTMTYSDSFNLGFGVHSTTTGQDFNYYLVVQE